MALAGDAADPHVIAGETCKKLEKYRNYRIIRGIGGRRWACLIFH